jgi:hypothetical protein
MKLVLLFALSGVILSLTSVLCPGARATNPVQPQQAESDWGYEDYGKNLSGGERGRETGKFQDSGPPAPLSPATSSIPEPEPVKGLSARALSIDWGKDNELRHVPKPLKDVAEFFELAAIHKLSPSQLADLKTLALAPSGNVADKGKENAWQRISTFMPAVRERIEQHQQEAEDFGHLFAALLRLAASSTSLPDSQKAVIENVLGPARLAVAGAPALSEDAVESYNNMACFMFEQKNPGKTVDADDNRAVFAHVIKDKFQEAPTEKDKLAMANFAITWSKFKIDWNMASPDKKSALLQSLAEGRSLADVPEESLTSKIFANGPWQQLLLRSSGRGDAVHRPAG